MWSILKYAMVSCTVGLFAAVAGLVAAWLTGIVVPDGSGSTIAGVATSALSASVLAGAGFALLNSFRQRNNAAQAMKLAHGASVDATITATTLTAQPTTAPSMTPPTRMASKRRTHKPIARVSGKTLRWSSLSKSAAAILGQSEVDLIGKSIYHRVHPKDIVVLENAIRLARSSEITHRCMCRFIPPGDNLSAHKFEVADRSADTAILPLHAPEVCTYVQLAIRWRRKKSDLLVKLSDATALCRPRDVELLAMRKSLLEKENEYQAACLDLDRLKLSYRELYQYAPVMYFSVDLEGRLVTFNETLLRTLGYDRVDLHNQSYTKLLTPDARKNYIAISKNMPPHEGEIETRWCKKDGTIINIWLHTTPVLDEDGRFVRCRNAALDLTEKIRFANEARTRGDQLEQTNQRLRGINNELEAFTHVVSHDLKEPLRTLQAYSHLLAEEHGARLGADGFQYVNHMIRASRRLGSLIDELLKLGQAGRITRDRQIFNLIEVVATVRQDLVDLIQRKNASVLTEGSLADLIGDTARVTQLLANLVGNGLKYNKNETPTVVIGVANETHEPGFATIFVRDNGIGIAPVFHKQIFGIFRRLHQEDEYEGTGAGLAICKKIVEAHGGRIWLESTRGEGATFYFTLPVAPARLGEQTQAPRLSDNDRGLQTAVRRVDSSTESSKPVKPRIVLVDDQHDVGLIIQKIGKRDGLAILWFPTAEEALTHMQTASADLLLLDINLPGMNGIELCKRLRSLPHLAMARIAMFTPDQDDDALQELRAAGADSFLTKDLLCNPLKWQQKMQELLEQFHSAQASNITE